jgi:hypothetical protein
MGLHGRLADEEFAGDLAVRGALGDQGEDLAFAGGERFVARGLGAADRGDQAGGDGGREDRAAFRRRADRGEEFVARGVLQQIARRARLDRGERVGVGVVRRQDEHLRAGGAAGQLADGVDARAARHPQVHQDDVGVEVGGPLHGLDAVGRLAQDAESGRGLEHAAQTVPYDGMVVDDQQGDQQLVTHGGPTVREPRGPCRDRARPRW